MSLIGEGMEILGLINKAQNADLYKQIGEWIDKVVKLQAQVDGLTQENKDFKEQLRFKGIVERQNGLTFVQGDDEEVCPRCAEADHRAIHLMVLRIPPTGSRVGCPQCGLQTQRHVLIKRSQLGAE